jgi:hypothetical protein
MCRFAQSLNNQKCEPKTACESLRTLINRKPVLEKTKPSQNSFSDGKAGDALMKDEIDNVTVRSTPESARDESRADYD